MDGEAREVRFQELIDEVLLVVNDGYRAKHSELGIGGPIFLRAVHLQDAGFDFAGVQYFRDDARERVVAKMAMPGDTVVTTKGNSTGRTGYVSESMPPFVYSPHLSFWRSLDHSKLKPLFLRYWARGPEFRDQLNGLKESTDMAPYLSLTDQRRLRITVPGPRTQEAIGNLLGALDEKIEANRAMNETLEATCQALFRSWFVDFDPVVAKSEGRRPVHLTDDVAALFPERLQDSPLGPAPAGWTPSKLGALLVLSYGKALPERERVPGKIPVYGSNGAVGLHAEALVDGPGIIVGRKGSAGCVTWCHTDFFPIDTTFYVESRGLPLLYHFYLLKQLDLESFAGDSAVPGLNRELTYLLDVVVPPTALTELFETVVGPLFAQIQHHDGESQTLAVLRDGLLPKLLSGELRVREAELLVEEAV